MSASEKLRALEDEWPESLLLAAIPLPQIVAVVEAAEDTEYATDPEWPLFAALTALDEALS